MDPRHSFKDQELTIINTYYKGDNGEQHVIEENIFSDCRDADVE